MDEYQIPQRTIEVERERERERETVKEHCSFCQGQMVRAALVLHSLSACQAMTHTHMHAHTQNYLILFVQQWSSVCGGRSESDLLD